MANAKKYKGGCHCGKVAYEVETDLGTVMQCNCSLCSKAGWLLTFVPAKQFDLARGDDAVTDYQFNKHRLHHVFCTTCGVRSFSRGKGADGSDMVGVNVRCLEGVEPGSYTVKDFDGRSK